MQFPQTNKYSSLGGPSEMAVWFSDAVEIDLDMKMHEIIQKIGEI